MTGQSERTVPVPPSVGEDDRWELVETDTEAFGHRRLVTVDSHRALYGDRRLREAVRAATGRDRLWRAVFFTRLTTTPPLTPGIADLVVRSIAFPRARSQFASDLADRGFTDVTEAERRRLPVGDDARAARYTAVVPPATDAHAAASAGAGPDSDARDRDRDRDHDPAADGVPVHAWIAVWDRETDMLAAGGLYPVAAPAGVDDAVETPETYRRRLFELLTAVDSAE